MSSSSAAARMPTRPVTRPLSRERTQPRLRVVAPAPHRSATGLALLCVVLLGCGLLALLLLNISIGKGAYTLTGLQTQQRQLQERKQALAEQVEGESAPQALASTAEKLGMVAAPHTAFVRLPDGRVEGDPASAQPTTPPATVKGQRTTPNQTVPEPQR